MAKTGVMHSIISSIGNPQIDSRIILTTSDKVLRKWSATRTVRMRWDIIIAIELVGEAETDLGFRQSVAICAATAEVLGWSFLNRQHLRNSLHPFLYPLMKWRAVPSFAVSALVVTAGAINPRLTNSLSNGNGPILYYNGSGPVPPYGLLSPIPEPLPPLR